MAVRKNARKALKSFTVLTPTIVDRALPPVPDRTWLRCEQMAAISVWKITALSCDLDPDALRISTKSKLIDSGTPRSEAVRKKVIRLGIPADKFEEYKDRWTITVNCLLHGEGITPRRKNSRPAFATVRVGDFVRFANAKGWELPHKLREICREPDQPNTDNKKKEQWEVPGTLAYKARKIGLDYMQECKKNKKSVNSKSLADYVATEMRQRNLRGPRGFWSAETAKRQALTGITGRKPNGR